VRAARRSVSFRYEHSVHRGRGETPKQTTLQWDLCLAAVAARPCGWRIVVSAIIPWDFAGLLRLCDARSGRSFHPLHRYPSPLTRTWWRPFHSCGVASPQAPTPDRESLQAPVAESIRVRSHPCRLDRARGASYTSAPVRHRTETLGGCPSIQLCTADFD
jgi:hypothetical protein